MMEHCHTTASPWNIMGVSEIFSWSCKMHWAQSSKLCLWFLHRCWMDEKEPQTLGLKVQAPFFNRHPRNLLWYGVTKCTLAKACRMSSEWFGLEDRFHVTAENILLYYPFEKKQVIKKRNTDTKTREALSAIWNCLSKGRGGDRIIAVSSILPNS